MSDQEGTIFAHDTGNIRPEFVIGHWTREEDDELVTVYDDLMTQIGQDRHKISFREHAVKYMKWTLADWDDSSLVWENDETGANMKWTKVKLQRIRIDQTKTHAQAQSMHASFLADHCDARGDEFLSAASDSPIIGARRASSVNGRVPADRAGRLTFPEPIELLQSNTKADTSAGRFMIGTPASSRHSIQLGLNVAKEEKPEYESKAWAGYSKPCDHKLLASIPLTMLSDPDFLSRHLDSLERTCRSVNVFDGKEPHGHLLPQFLDKVVQTLHKFGAVHEYALRIIQSRGDPTWTTLSRSLKSRFNSPELLEAAYRSKVKRLRFDGVQAHEEFLTGCSGVLALMDQVYPGDSGERRRAIRDIISLIPEPYRYNILLKLKAQGSVTWELTAWDDEPNCIADCVREVLHTAWMSSLMDTTAPTSDKNRYAGQRPPTANASQPAETSSWARRYKDPVYVSGDMVNNKEKTITTLKNSGINEGDLLFGVNMYGYPYLVVGMESDGPAQVSAALAAQQTRDQNERASSPRKTQRNTDDDQPGPDVNRTKTDSRYITNGPERSQQPQEKPENTKQANSATHPLLEEGGGKEQIANTRFDRVSAINKTKSTPEIRFNGNFQAVNRTEEHAVQCIADTGAGCSYIILTTKDLEVLSPEPCAAHTVYFANQTKQVIRSALRVDLTLYADISGNQFTQRIQLFPLVVDDTTELELILGRDALEKFAISIQGGKQASIGDEIIFASSNDSTDDPRGYDVLNMLRSLSENATHEINIYEDPASTGIIITKKDGTEFLTDEWEADELDESIPEPSVQIIADPAGSLFGRVQTSIPWRSDARPPLNRAQVSIRDIKTTAKLSGDQQRLYGEAVQTLIDEGFATPAGPGSPGHFVAINPVFKQEGKCRLCIDARQCNSFTHTGSTQSRALTECFALFRSRTYTSTFDLSQAFRRILMAEEDQRYCCSIISGRVIQFRTLCFGTNYSPAVLELAVRLINEAAAAHLKQLGPLSSDEPERPTDSTVTSANYVDDFCTRSDDQAAEAKQVTWLRWIYEKFGFPSGKFHSNATPQQVPDEWTRYLGYEWNTTSDLIRSRVYDIKQLEENERVTVRELLQKIAMFYDPMGYHLGHQLMSRMLLREAFQEVKTRPAWNQLISKELQTKLRKWIELVPSTTMTTPRMLDFSTLNVFSDASGTAWCYEVRDHQLALVFSRAGLLSKETVPRGELIGLFMAIQDVSVMNLAELRCNRVNYYTDSECNVHRLRRSGKLPRFEQNRVDRMRKLLHDSPIPTVVTHIEGVSNPSDYSTRPERINSSTRPPIDFDELRLVCEDPTNLSYVPTHDSDDSGGEGVEEIDSLFRVMRMTTRAERRRLTAAPAAEPTGAQVTDGVVEAPAIDIIGMTGEPEPVPDAFEQMNQLMERIRTQQQMTMTEMPPHILADDSGLLRWKGQGLMIVDENIITEVLDRYHGERHNGVTATYNTIRKDFHIKNLHRLVKNYIRNCQICQRARAHRAFQSQLNESTIGELEEIGINSVVGIDICTVDSTSDNKCFITVTCCVSKFLRTRPLGDQTSDTVVAALDEMFANSIYPRIIATDGAPTFRSRTFRIWLLRNRISQITFPPYASQYAGWVERCHQAVLSGLRVLVAGHTNRDWSDYLPRATWLANTRPYDNSDECGVSPLHMAFPSFNFRANPWDFDLEQNEQLLKSARVGHLSTPPLENMIGLQEKAKVKAKNLVDAYERVFESKRWKIQERLHREGGRVFEVGDRVRVYRPSISKVALTWSNDVREIVEKPSSATRIVCDLSGRRTLEHVLNLCLVVGGSVP